MKRFLLLTVVFMLFIVSAASEAVVQMPYTLITPEYIREGLYTGQFVNGQPEGYGLFTTVNDTGVGWHYIGYWVNGLMQGEGGTYWEDGACEVGIYDHSYFMDGYAMDSAGFSPVTNTPAPTQQTVQYIGNRKTHKFHQLTCGSINDIKEGNRVELYSREEAIDAGYQPCGRCNP